MANYNLTLFEFVHNKKIIELVKKYFKTKVIFSSRPCIHVHDDTNKHILLPHQETNMFSVDGILLWVPLFDTNKDTGGLTIYKKSHKRGFFKHTTKDPSGKKRWTNNYTNIHPSIYNNFKKVNLEVKSGSAVLMINSLISSIFAFDKIGLCINGLTYSQVCEYCGSSVTISSFDGTQFQSDSEGFTFQILGKFP